MKQINSNINIKIYKDVYRIEATPEPTPPPKHVWTFENSCPAELVLHHHRVIASRPEEGGSRRGMKLSRRGWVCRSFSSFNDLEHKAIKAWAKTHGPSKVWVTKIDRFRGPEAIRGFIGGYESFCMGVWTFNQELMNELVELVETFEPRTKFLNVRSLAAVLPLIEGTNYHYVEGDDSIALGLTDEVSDETLTLIRIATG